MAKKGRAKGEARGRVTPKGGPAASGRYTPPVPKSEKVSPVWVPAIMFTCLILGMTIIIVNYTGVLPGGTKNGYLILGLALITGGFITATQYH
jgi:hypothetical protein